MKKEPKTTPLPEERPARLRGGSARARLAQFHGSRQRSILGLAEIVALAVAGLLLLITIIAYVSFLVPARARHERAQKDRQDLQRQLEQATEGHKVSENTKATVDDILESLQKFESEHLVSYNTAGTAVIEELNSLIRRNKLRITTGISFTQFETVDPAIAAATQQQRAPAASSIKALQNIFPGVGVNLTVEGGYAELRRFIRDVEADRRFIVINAIELEGVTDSSAPRTLPDGTIAPAARISLVSLRLNLAAYFRRLNAPAIATVEGDAHEASATRR